MVERLIDLVRAELGQAVDPRVTAMAAAIAAQHPKAARAVLFYGSCLRRNQLDGLMLDFYLIVSDYRAAYEKRWLAMANRLIPPNVFAFELDGIAAKYAVLDEQHFLRECGPAARTASVFARFAQPSRLVWSADEQARQMALNAVSQAAPSLLELTRPTMSDESAAETLAIWRKGFTLTYGAELRAERDSQPGAIIDADPDRYRRVAHAAGFPRHKGLTPEQRRLYEEAWRRFQRRGKRVTLVRLAKASLTYAGGADYLAWKINRHAGTRIEVRPWQRRWPLLGALILLPRLWLRGAIR